MNVSTYSTDELHATLDEIATVRRCGATAWEAQLADRLESQINDELMKRGTPQGGRHDD